MDRILPAVPLSLERVREKSERESERERDRERERRDREERQREAGRPVGVGEPEWIASFRVPIRVRVLPTTLRHCLP